MEIWKDIPGWDGIYQASDEGQVRSVDRRIKGSKPNQQTRFMRGRILKPRINKETGYKYVNLSRPGKKPKSMHVHEIILLTFTGPRPDWCEEIRHWDGVKTNCRWGNLLYGTLKENRQDNLRHGLLLNGHIPK